MNNRKMTIIRGFIALGMILINIGFIKSMITAFDFLNEGLLIPIGLLFFFDAVVLYLLLAD